MERTQTLRIDCPQCHGKGYIERNGVQDTCDRCEGAGMLQKEVSYKFETQGRWSQNELAEEFGMSPSEISDSGHSSGE